MQFKNYIIIFISFLLLSSCVKKSHNIGKDLISTDEFFTIKDTVIINSTATNYKFISPFGLSEEMLIGNSDSLEAVSLLNFSALISDTLSSVKIDTAEITLFSSYTFNLSNNKNEFEIFEMPTIWNRTTFNGDSLKNINLNSKVGAINDSISIYKNFKIQIDTSSIRKFINDILDSTKPSFNGFAIKSKFNAKGFLGFYSFQSIYPPTLKIKFSKNGKRDSISFSSGVSTFGVNEKYSSLKNDDNIIIQGGVNYRSQIKFDLKYLPTSAVINRATLELKIKSKQLGLGKTDSLIVSIVRSNSPADTVHLFPLYLFRQTADSTSYFANLTTHAQSWIIDSTINLGILIRSAYENSSIDKFEFYNKNDNSNLIPRLKITYSTK